MLEPSQPPNSPTGRLPAENHSSELTEIQATLLAQLLKQLRPEWEVPSMMKLLWEHRTYAPFPALVEAAVKVARNPEKKTPIIIFKDGKHWLTDEKAASPAHTAAIGNEPPCEEHPLEDMSTCKHCKPLKKPAPPNFRDMIRAATERKTP
ncbi:hypothetical protein B0G38_002086 [Arthrobacter sp. VKM Ac-2550]|nr:hypothetical protein [Arthrobacter sp. VKM Ac-2550]